MVTGWLIKAMNQGPQKFGCSLAFPVPLSSIWCQWLTSLGILNPPTQGPGVRQTVTTSAVVKVPVSSKMLPAPQDWMTVLVLFLTDNMCIINIPMQPFFDFMKDWEAQKSANGQLLNDK